MKGLGGGIKEFKKASQEDDKKEEDKKIEDNKQFFKLKLNKKPENFSGFLFKKSFLF